MVRFKFQLPSTQEFKLFGLDAISLVGHSFFIDGLLRLLPNLLMVRCSNCLWAVTKLCLSCIWGAQVSVRWSCKVAFFGGRVKVLVHYYVKSWLWPVQRPSNIWSQFFSRPLSRIYWKIYRLRKCGRWSGLSKLRAELLPNWSSSRPFHNRRYSPQHLQCWWENQISFFWRENLSLRPA